QPGHHPRRRHRGHQRRRLPAHPRRPPRPHHPRRGPPPPRPQLGQKRTFTEHAGALPPSCREFVTYRRPRRSRPSRTTGRQRTGNNISAAIAHVDVSATAKDPRGKIVASGSSQGTDPSTVQPGQWAFAYIYFESGTALARNDTLSFTFQSMPASTDSF